MAWRRGYASLAEVAEQQNGVFMLDFARLDEACDEDLDLVSVLAERTWIAIEKIEVNRTLVRRATQLAATDRLKNEFLATLGHELRNPLTTLRISLEFGKDASEEDVRASMADALSDVDRLEHAGWSVVVSGKLAAQRVQQFAEARL